MPRSMQSQGKFRVRCFCGNSLTVSRNARKSVICDKCRQPLPLQAIKLAIADRDAEILEQTAAHKHEVPTVFN